MSDTRPVPTNLDGWPGVTDLVVPYKHILHVLWSAPSSLVSVIGVGRPGIVEHLTSAARQDEPVTMEALRELHRRGLVVLDEQTREVAIRRWCRVHKFAGRWAAQAKIAFDRIESASIKSVLVRHEGVNAIFPEKSKAADPNSNCNCNCNEEAASRAACGSADAAASIIKEKRRHPLRTQAGIECWYPSEDSEAAAIEDSTPPEQIAAAVLTIRARQNSANKPTSPVPALVKAELERQHREHLVAEQQAATAHRVAAADTPIDPAAQAKGALKLSPTFQAQLAQKLTPKTTHQEATP